MTKCDSVQLQLPTKKFNNNEIKRKHSSIKLSDIIHDEKKLTWKNSEVIENKIDKTIAVFYRDNYLLDFRSLPKI